MGKLVLVATPIGNMGDLSERAIETLAEADIIAAEDTRRSGLLLSKLGIKKPLVSYYKHNEKSRADYLLSEMAAGKTVAVISDAGMPGIADPGSDIVKQAIEAGEQVSAVPGACAMVTALVISGLPTEKFVFEGFLPRGRECIAHLQTLKTEHRTMIFYEAPHRLPETLDALMQVFGADRQAAVCRELTKVYEEVNRGTLAELCEMWHERKIQGEFVIVVAGAEPEEAGTVSDDELRAAMSRLIDGGMKARAAAKEVAARYGVQTNYVYQLVLLDKDNQ